MKRKNRRLKRTQRKTFSMKLKRTKDHFINQMKRLASKLSKFRALDKESKLRQSLISKMSNWQRHQMRKAQVDTIMPIEEVKRFASLQRKF